MKLRTPFAIAIVVCISGCKVGGCIAATLGDVVGETSDVACDRRFVTPPHKPGSFCQEVIDTVAVSQVEDDCKRKFGARPIDDKCPRDKIIAGCKLHKDNDDGSEVYDWYYDISDLEDASAQKALDAGADADAGPLFEDPARTKEDVMALCADPKRYDEGASYVDHP